MLVELGTCGKNRHCTFLYGFRRFHLSERKNTDYIYTDNGTDFRGTVNLFGKLDWDKIQIKFKAERITWIFNPAAALWWGCFWERLLRTMKEFCEVFWDKSRIGHTESLINARLLTHLSEDPDDLLPITPSAFIQNVQSSEYPEIKEIIGKSIREKLQHMNQLKQELRSRFRS